MERPQIIRRSDDEGLDIVIKYFVILVSIDDPCVNPLRIRMFATTLKPSYSRSHEQL